MYELIQVSEHCYYIACPAKIGVVKTGADTVCLIDSGSDKDAAKKVKKHLDANGWKLDAIYNTHSNADHIGSNLYLHEQTGCRIYAPGVECAMTRHPILEPAYLYGGFPLKALKNKFLMAQASPAEYLTPDVLPEGFEIIPLGGHFFDMVGFKTPDGVAFIADCLSSEQTLQKYGVGVIVDVEEYIKTLERIKTMEAKLFIPSHAEPTDDIAPLAQVNIDAVLHTSEQILSLCAEPVTFDELIGRLFDSMGLSLSLQQYVLVGSTVKSYLAWLCDKGQMTVTAENNRLVWKKA